jgi:hypothetical protein
MDHVINDLLTTFYRQFNRHCHGQFEGIDTLSIVGFQQQATDFEADLWIM